MKVGQMTFPRASKTADYLQLNICGLTKEPALEKAAKYEDIPFILHGDWTNKGCSENNIVLKERQEEYKELIEALKQKYNLLGFTIHPPSRKKMPLEEFVRVVERLEKETDVPFFIENRSSSSIWLSNPNEIIDFSLKHKMTIDIPQLYISCGYDVEKLLEVCSRICWKNVREVHLSNVMRTEKNTLVARKLNDGLIPIEALIPFIERSDYVTLEILGGSGVFEQEKERLLKWNEHKEAK